MKAWIIMIILAFSVFAGSIVLATGNFCGGIIAITMATPTPAGSQPQFSRTGVIQTSYSTSPQSMFVRSVIKGAGPILVGPAASDASAAGINAFELPLYPLNTDLLGVSFNGQSCGTTAATFNATCAENWWVTTQWNNWVNSYNSNHIAFAWDAGKPQLNGNYFSQELPFQAFVSSYAFTHESTVNSPFQLGADEWTGCEFACNTDGTGPVLDNYGFNFKGDPNGESMSYAPPPGQPNACSGAGVQPACPAAFPGNPFSHVPFAIQEFGMFPVPTHYPYINTGTAMISDFMVMETGNFPFCQVSNANGCSVSDSSLNTYAQTGVTSANVDNTVNTVNAARAGLPSEIYVHADGAHYLKEHTGRPFAFLPGTDFPEGGNTTTGNYFANTPGTVTSQIWFSVAHGMAGTRLYAYDSYNGPGPCQARQSTSVAGGAIGQDQQANLSPSTDWNAHGCLGQDRWYAMAVSYNLIGLLEPYILQPFAATQLTGCNKFPLNNAGNKLYCGVKSGTVNGVTSYLTVLVNWSDSSISYAYNPTAYFTQGGTANLYQITFPSETSQADHGWGCGSQLSAYAAGINGNVATNADPYTNNTTAANGGPLNVPYDCGRGETRINGTSPALTTTFTLPAALVAPGGTGQCGGIAGGTWNGTTCTYTLSPHEADIAVYHP